MGENNKPHPLIEAIAQAMYKFACKNGDGYVGDMGPHDDLTYVILDGRFDLIALAEAAAREMLLGMIADLDVPKAQNHEDPEDRLRAFAAEIGVDLADPNAVQDGVCRRCRGSGYDTEGVIRHQCDACAGTGKTPEVRRG